MTTVLIVEDMEENQQTYSHIVKEVGDKLQLGVTIKRVKEYEEAQQFFQDAKQKREETPALILLDMEIWHHNRRDQRGGYELMRKYQNTFPETYWIAITANEVLQRRAALGEHGLFDQLYELKPFDFYLKGRSRDLEDMVRRALQMIKETVAEESPITDQLPGRREVDDLNYVAPNYHLYYQIRAAAETSRTIFLYGEAGTGKTTIAAFIHRHSSRTEKRFRSIDGKLEADLLKKLLFEGNDGNPALLEQVRGGTIYIADFDKLGGGGQDETFKLQRELRHYIVYLGYDVRLIAGIHKRRDDIIPSIRELVIPEWLDKALSLDIPSLNERKEDIPTLVELFLRQFNESGRKEQPRYLLDAGNIYELLRNYDWSNGNISLLKMVVEDALLTSTPAVTVDDCREALGRIGGVSGEEQENKRRESEDEREREREREQQAEVPFEEELKTARRAERQPQTPPPAKKEPLVITAEDLRRFGIR